jgi:uncharacterized membrane protein YcaP (DUF421 family)
MNLDDLPLVVRTLVAGMAAYVALIVALRVSGKRTLAKWNAFDFVVTIALGSLLASTVTASGTSVAQGVAGFVVLIALQFTIAWLAVRFGFVRRWTKAQPRLLLRDGRFDDRALRDERVTRAEVLAAIRATGIGDIEKTAAVVLETDGSVSVISGAASRSALCDVAGEDAQHPQSGRTPS